jgi:hypothetical protein
LTGLADGGARAWWRGGFAGCMAARGARAAAGDGGDRIRQWRRVGRCLRGLFGRVRQGPQRNRLRRRPGDVVAALAVEAAITTIPIEFGVGENPVKIGLVANLARPDGNATGFNFFNAEVDAKWLGLLHDLVRA